MPCRHILVIEDEADLRETLRDFLELVGFQVETATNGREGLDKLDAIGHPCLIMLDLMMPVMNGWQFLESIRSDSRPGRAAIPVVVVSAAADVSDVQSRYGCRSLGKPVDIDRLLALANQHCESC